MARIREVEAAYDSLKSQHAHATVWPQRNSTMLYEWANGRVLLDEHKTAAVLREYSNAKGDRLDVLYDIQVTLRELGETRLSPAFVPTRSMSGIEVRLVLAS